MSDPEAEPESMTRIAKLPLPAIASVGCVPPTISMPLPTRWRAGEGSAPARRPHFLGKTSDVR